VRRFLKLVLVNATNPNETGNTMLMTIAQIARAHNINPKVARTKLRRHGRTSNSNGRWPRVRKGSTTYKQIVNLLIAA
jgi:hypothetical protein